MNIISWTESAVNDFARLDPSDKEVAEVVDVVYEVLQNAEMSDFGFPIPFAPEELKGACVAWTTDKKWRILFQPKPPNHLIVLAVQPETRILTP